MPKQNQIRAVHTLIHIGCGANPNIDEYISLAEHVWLIDADTEVLDKLEEIIQAPESESYRNIHTRLALVDTEQGKATFHRYSLPWASGVTPIDEKTQRLYPGLQCLSSEEKTTIAITALVKECLSSTANENIDNHMLLLDCGYQNEALLQALEVSDELSCFSIVVVIPTYRQQKPIAVPLSLYTPEQPSIKLTLPNNSQILDQLPLIKVIKKLKIEANREHQKLEQRLLEQENQLAECVRQRDELVNYEKNILFERDTQRATLKDSQYNNEKLKSEYNLLLDEYKKLKLDNEEYQYSVQLSTKLLAKSELDISELRDRYARLRDSEQELRDLISELHSKLEAAWLFYQNLSQKHPELLEDL